MKKTIIGLLLVAVMLLSPIAAFADTVADSTDTQEPSKSEYTTVVDNEDSEAAEFSVVLKDLDRSNKIKVVNIIREFTGKGLKEAHGLIELTPVSLKDDCTKEEAEAFKAKLEEAGAVVELRTEVGALDSSELSGSIMGASNMYAFGIMLIAVAAAGTFIVVRHKKKSV